MRSLLRNVAALIAAITIFQIAAGLIGVRLPLTVAAENMSRTALGLIAASYGAGFMLGATLATILLARVGHIRVYAASAAIFAVTVLGAHFATELWSWALTRMIAGVAAALVFAAVESWISSSISAGSRGEVTSVYMVVTKVALALGPYLGAGYGQPAAEPWMMAAALVALSLVPICFTSSEQPLPPKATPLALVEQFEIAPAAVLAAFGSGLINSGVMTLAPLYASEHFGATSAAEFYSAAWTGSLLLQWPAGRVSDRVDRRLVIAVLTGIAATTALWLALFPGLPSWAALLVFTLWGGGALSFYGIAVAHMADRAEPGKIAQSAAGVLFVWAGGSVIGPLVLGVIVDAVGLGGMFWYAGIGAALIAAAMFWRRGAREASEPQHKEEYVPDAGISVAGGELAYGEDKPEKI